MSFRLERRAAAALVTVPERLGRAALESAVTVLDELEGDDWSAAVFTGSGAFFCTGADIDEIAVVRSPDDVRAGSRAGHELFARIRALPFPTVAAINGACLGGGLELALHCDLRTIALGVRHLGLPEVALSIVPGWGGTQLLPKLVGPETATRVIALNPLRQNRLLNADDAAELGIVDRVLEPDELLDASLALAADGSQATRREPDWGDLESVVRRARARIDDAVHGATPAPYVALDLVAGARDWTLPEGYAAEEEALAELIVSPQARASVYAFTVVERRAKRPAELPYAPPRPIRKVGVVGAGLMGTQLAALFARRVGVPLVLTDVDEARLAEALDTIGASVERGSLEGCDLVLEAVVEDLGVKRAVIAEARRVAPAALLATNTSSLSVAAIGADVGLHFFNPVAVLPLVEIVRTSRTSDEQLATAWQVVTSLRKRGVIVRDTPGFVVNRLLARMSTVLLDAIASGSTVEETDEAILSLGLPMAPSVVRELVGPAVAERVLASLHAAWPDRFPLEPRAGEHRSVERIRADALDAVRDEVRRLLRDRVVSGPADVDACLILGAGWPLFLGGAVTGCGKICA